MARGKKVTLVVDEPIFVKNLSKDEEKVLATTVRDKIVENFEKI